MSCWRGTLSALRFPLKTTKVLWEPKHSRLALDQASPPTHELIQIVVCAMSAARRVDLSWLEERVHPAREA